MLPKHASVLSRDADAGRPQLSSKKDGSGRSRALPPRNGHQRRHWWFRRLPPRDRPGSVRRARATLQPHRGVRDSKKHPPMLSFSRPPCRTLTDRTIIQTEWQNRNGQYHDLSVAASRLGKPRRSDELPSCTATTRNISASGNTAKCRLILRSLPELSK